MKVTSARRVAELVRPKPGGASSAWAKTGHRYERSVARALAASSDCLAIHNPQFQFTYTARSAQVAETQAQVTSAHCVPDFIVTNLPFLHPMAAIVLECKLTYKPEAREKLIDVYVPVVKLALGTELVFPVVVAKNLTKVAPEPHFNLKTAIFGRLVPCHKNLPVPTPPVLANFVPVVLWLGRGEFPISG